MRTLVISDLHLGARLRPGVLHRPQPLECLLEALAGCDRLVLLGDVLELPQGDEYQALDQATPVLAALGSALGPEREVIVVPGNHDLGLIRSWLREAVTELTPDTPVPLAATPALQRLSAALRPARVTVNYPGVWLEQRVWATHGHYLDRHLLPESTYGIARGLLGRLPRAGATVEDYERAGGPSVTRIEAYLLQRLPRRLAALVEDLAELLRASTMPLAPHLFLHPRMARFTAWALGAQMRRASIPALARVVHRLGVEADWVLFGHVHRLGPLPGDRLSDWQGPAGAPRIANTGSWAYEPLLVHDARPPHPYWPGGAVLIEHDVAPRAIGLLDELP
ncbi:MAG TPA: metallophosphoesterase, partial [Solirubrobacteraceae bacterium]